MNQSPDSQKMVLVSASGSGGHLMPARYAIQEFQKRGIPVEFLGSGRPLEQELLGDLGIELHQIPVEGIQNRGARGIVQFLSRFLPNLLRTRALFRQRNPQAVVGFGGYATFFPVFWARLSGIPSLIHEAEQHPGAANRVLSYFANKISCAFEDTKFPGRGEVFFAGHPIRPELKRLVNQSRSISTPSNLLILGGSQGAQSIDEGCAALAPLFKQLGLHIWHQCRPENVQMLQERYEEFGFEKRVSPFIHELDKAFEWAHFVVSRSGAGAVMEIGFVNCPAIFVPYPHAQGNHQLRNAEILQKQGKALIVEEGEGFVKRLATSIENILDPDTYNRMRLQAGKGRPVDAVEKIVSEVLTLCEKNAPRA